MIETLNADRKPGKYVWSALDQQQSSFGTMGRYSANLILTGWK
jgi:hypothetical protein